MRDLSIPLALLGSLAVACGGPSGADRPVAPSPHNGSPAMVEQLLGKPAELAVLVDTAAMRGDDVYRDVFARYPLSALMRHAGVKWTLERVDAVEIWLTDLELVTAMPVGVIVLRSGRITETELSLLAPDVVFERRTVLPSGAVLFPVQTRTGSGALSGAAFLVDGNLVFAYGAPMLAAHDHFRSSRALPPRLDFGADVLVGAHFHKDLEPLRRYLDGAEGYAFHLDSASALLRSGRRGDALLTVRFDDETSAIAAARDSGGALGHGLRRGCTSTSLRRDGSSLTFRVEDIPTAIARLLDGATCS
ncbi:MAG TPA: hypothetical protein VMZ28_06335 [Kofleriaceae bacterium]|nr:hypothetical protein [Kofleriaceae bacterium]